MIPNYCYSDESDSSVDSSISSDEDLIRRKIIRIEHYVELVHNYSKHGFKKLIFDINNKHNLYKTAIGVKPKQISLSLRGKGKSLGRASSRDAQGQRNSVRYDLGDWQQLRLMKGKRLLSDIGEITW